MRGRSLARITVVFSLLALTFSGLPAGAVGQERQTDCSVMPDIVPVADLAPGTTGTGYTVVKGTTVDSFSFEVLGVIPDGLGLDVDVIVVETSGPIIDDLGGIAFGFSGSPVYTDDGLIGAISLYLGGSPRIAGVTAAQAMVDVLDYPATPAPAAAAGTVALTPTVRQAVADALGMDVSQVKASLQQLRIPLVVSGVRQDRVSAIQDLFDQRGISVQVMAGGTAALPDTSTDPILPGESLAGALSYGDVSAFGTGTATICRDDRVVGFGHPFFWRGEVNLGMNGADIITTIPGGGFLNFPAFKVPVLAQTHGRIDRDHLAAIRGIVGEYLSTIPITSDFTGLDLGKSRVGDTHAVMEELIDAIVFFHMFQNIDAVFDAISQGSSSLGWTIEGTRAGGAPFALDRDNKYFGFFDISVESSFELADQLFQIVNNPFEEVHITSVDIHDGTVTRQRLTYEIVQVLSSTSSNPDPAPNDVLFVNPGDTVHLDVHLRPFGSTDVVVARVDVPIPADIAGGSGFLSVRGGQGFFFFFGGAETLNGPVNGSPDESFDDLLARLEGADHNYDLVVEGEIFPFFDGEPPHEAFPMNGGGGDGFVRIHEVAPQDQVVLGQRFLELIIEEPFEPGPEPPPGPVFTDAGGIFRDAIRWMAQQRITDGCSPTRFCPNDFVTRGQMARFLRRAIGLDFVAEDFFGDDDGSRFERDINALAGARITFGCAPGKYCPDQLLTRGQMASLLFRALGLARSPVDFFGDDDGNIHENAINALADARITNGCAPGLYCPGNFVTRGQTAAFLHRALGGG